VLPQHILQFRLYKLSPCSAGDHRVHSDTSLLWLHRADGLHLLARDRHDWILRCLLLHPQDLRGYQDWLSRQSGIIRRFAVSAGNLFPWLCDTARLVEWLAPCVSSGLTGWPFLENLVLLGNLVAVRETSRNWPNVRENSLSEKKLSVAYCKLEIYISVIVGCCHPFKGLVKSFWTFHSDIYIVLVALTKWMLEIEISITTLLWRVGENVWEFHSASSVVALDSIDVKKRWIKFF